MLAAPPDLAPLHALHSKLEELLLLQTKTQTYLSKLEGQIYEIEQIVDKRSSGMPKDYDYIDHLELPAS